MSGNKKNAPDCSHANLGIENKNKIKFKQIMPKENLLSNFGVALAALLH